MLFSKLPSHMRNVWNERGIADVQLPESSTLAAALRMLRRFRAMAQPRDLSDVALDLTA
jgi:hypothetical protein